MLEKQTKVAYALYFFLAAYYVLTITFVHPGLFLGDSAFQYYEFRTHHYTDWQPPMMNIWWSIFRISSAPFIAHLSIFTLGVYVFINTFLKDRQPFRAIMVFIVLMNPLVSLSMLNILKDNAMIASLIFICAILYKYSREQIRFGWSIGILFFLLIYVFGVRQNAAFALYPLLVFLFLKTNQSFMAVIKACFCAFFACIVLFGINYFVTYTMYHASKDHPEVIMMKYDLAAIECFTHHQYKIPNPVFAEPEQESENRHKLCEDFSVKQSDSLFWWTPENRRPAFRGGATLEQYQIIKTEWMRVIPQYWVDYLRFRGQVFSHSLAYNNWYLGAPTHDEYGFQTSIAQPGVYGILNKIYIVSHHIIGHYFGTFVLILNGCLLLISLTRSPRNIFKICLLLSGLWYELMWFFMLPVPDARYFLWFYIATCVSILLPDVNKMKGRL